MPSNIKFEGMFFLRGYFLLKLLSFHSLIVNFFHSARKFLPGENTGCGFFPHGIISLFP